MVKIRKFALTINKYTNPVWKIEELMRESDLVVSLGRGAYEAMACGCPVVYSATGGVPELVGEEAGIGVPGPRDWEDVHPPSAEKLAEAVVSVMSRGDERGRSSDQTRRERRRTHRCQSAPNQWEAR